MQQSPYRNLFCLVQVPLVAFPFVEGQEARKLKESAAKEIIISKLVLATTYLLNMASNFNTEYATIF